MTTNNRPINGRRTTSKGTENKLKKGDEYKATSQSKIKENASGGEKDLGEVIMSRADNSFLGMIKRYKNALIVLLSVLLTINVIFSIVLSLWFYQTVLDQENKINDLLLRIESMPEPISQGRLGLIIKKSNKNLENKLKENLVSVEKSIQKINEELDAFPKPMSEGKVGLILDKGIKTFRKDIEKQVNSVLSSFDRKDEKRTENKELSSEVRKKLKELDSSLEQLEATIGIENLSKSVTKEIADLKNFIKDIKKNNFSTEFNSKVLTSDLGSKDLTLITKQFPDYAYEAIKEDLKYNKQDGFVNSVINKFQLIFVKRSLTPQEGKSVDAILSRAENALNRGDFEQVVEELNQLPPWASEVMMDWRKSFDKYLEEKQ
ncbi:MAG: mitofilin family membrane protein [Pseudomonadota bacterium]|nr:mitofilin family membrane protein [Pseudomonadota bacterium]